MKQVRLLWLLLLIYGFAIADLSQKVLGKLDRGFNRGWTSGMHRGFEPLFYFQGFAAFAASLGAALTLWQLWRIHVQHLQTPRHLQTQDNSSRLTIFKA
jgi:hypothetical protein